MAHISLVILCSVFEVLSCFVYPSPYVRAGHPVNALTQDFLILALWNFQAVHVCGGREGVVLATGRCLAAS